MYTLCPLCGVASFIVRGPSGNQMGENLLHLYLLSTWVADEAQIVRYSANISGKYKDIIEEIVNSKDIDRGRYADVRVE
ncbi:MAG: hypothetical protein EZS28_011947 [Streblomastix strix]|uniref:Uncharacterized protein n=1 Tax=Streblomastix strix TaxID=222440 RepID=A0A5J4WCW7_9EUKA|nr:MAG: hypothetical protein EZS28_011947 [Streblomastix strix]